MVTSTGTVRARLCRTLNIYAGWTITERIPRRPPKIPSLRTTATAPQRQMMRTGGSSTVAGYPRHRRRALDAPELIRLCSPGKAIETGRRKSVAAGPKIRITKRTERQLNPPSLNAAGPPPGGVLRWSLRCDSMDFDMRFDCRRILATTHNKKWYCVWFSAIQYSAQDLARQPCDMPHGGSNCASL